MVELKNKKLVFHVHTKYSPDSLLEPKTIVDLLFKNGIEGVIITDHNTIKGAIEAKDYAKEKYNSKFLVIVGEEIETDIGDIIGFPLKKKIKSNKFMKVIKEIKKQKGFVVLSHPYKSHNLFKIHQKELLQKLDFIEVFSSRVSNELNDFAEQLAERNNVKKIIGSDAHFKDELLNTSLSFDKNWNLKELRKKESTLRNIRKSQIVKNFKKSNFGSLIKYLILYLLGK